MQKDTQNCLSKIATPSVLRWMGATVLLMIALLFAPRLMPGGCKEEVAPIARQDDTQAHDVFTSLIDKSLGTEWYGIYTLGSKVGYAMLTTSRDKGPDGTTYNMVLSHTVKVKARGEDIEIKIDYEEEFDGQPPYGLKRCSNKLKVKDVISETTIVKTSDGYKAKIVQGNETRTQMIGSLDYTLKHASAIETWLQKKPKVGDNIKHISLNLNTLETEDITSRIKAIRTAIVDGVKTKYYEVALTSASAEGVEVVQLYGVDGTAYTIVFGESIKYQLEPETLAMKLDEPIDLFVRNLVTIDQALGEPDNVSRLQLAIDSVSGSLIADAPGQTVRRDQANQGYVLTIDPNGEHRVKATDEEAKKNLKATIEIPSNHPKVIALAQEAVGDAKTTTQKVARLVKSVGEYIENVHMTTSLTVLDIIAKKQGDCSEHTKLFTAMARSQGIPCRRVNGLRYIGDRFKAFGLHAWNEVVIDGAWIPVDPIYEQTMIDATHIRFPVEMAEQWQVMASVPKLKIAVLDVQLKE